jgi:hypothetical protein
MWVRFPTDTFERRLKRYVKDRPNEMLFVLRNLSTYETALREGVNPIQIQEGNRFVHNERNGIYAVDQKGAPKNAKQIRLYLFPHLPTKTLYLLTVGDKNSQQRDIVDCRQMIQDIATREVSDEQTKQPPEEEKLDAEVPKPDGDGAGHNEG